MWQCVRSPGLVPLILMLFGGCPLSAQRPHVETYSLGAGLPSATIHDLAQDATGRLWIASRGGVSSYDGRTFRTVTSSQGLPSAAYQAVTADGEGRVWVLRRSLPRVFVRHRGEDWQALPAPPVNHSGRTWATTMEVVPEEGRTLVVVGTTREGLWLWDGGKWQQPGSEGALASAYVTGLARYRGGLAVATTQGLCELRTRRVDCRLRSVDPRLAGDIVAVNAVPDGSGTLLVAGPDWAGRLGDNGLEVLGESLGLRRFGPSGLGAIAADMVGGIYVGTPNRSWFWDPAERRFGEMGPRQGLEIGGITTILVDREANVWIGNQRGLARIGSRRFLSLDASHGLLESEVSAVAEAEGGLMVLGHNAGLTLLGPRGAVTLPFRTTQGGRIDHRRVLDIAVDGHGQVWLAAQAMGLLRLAPDPTWNAVDGIEHATSVELDPQGRLWVLEPHRLLVREDDGFTEVGITAAADDAPSFRWLRFGPDGRLYLASRRGLLIGDGDRWQRIHGPTPEADDIFNLLAEPARSGKEGTVWIGTAAGLYQLIGEHLIPASLDGQRLDRPVYQIFDDPRGRLWFGTDDGLRRWDAQELRHFTVRHGLAGRETNRGAGFVDHRGRVWVGTDQGVSLYQERYDEAPAAPPGLEVRSLEVLGVPRPFTAPVELGHRQSTFTFLVDLVALSREEAVEWRYRLEGFDEAWQGPERFTEGGLRYTNVPAGSYRLRIAARWAGSRQWSGELTSPEIVLRDPLWRRTWFLAVSGLLGGLLLVGGSMIGVVAARARARRLEAVNEKLSREMAEREKAEQALRASEARLATIFAASPDAISLSTLDEGTFLDVNEAFTHMSGYPREELLGRSSLEIDLWTIPEQRTEVARRLAEGPARNMEVTFRTKPGETVTCLVSAGIVEIGDQRMVLAVLRDITDRKQADEERERLIRELETRYAEIERFAYTLSHDLKSPLVTAKGFLGLLERDLELNAADRVRHDVGHLRGATDTMAALLDDLLVFLSVDPRVLRREQVALSELVQEVLGELAERLDRGRVEVHVESDLPGVAGDRRLLGQALYQLMDNALAYSGDQPAPRIEIGARTDEEGRCVLHLRDNGMGIEPRYQAKIFELFERLDSRTEGTGLGLALVRRVVELHGGRVWVESEGRGHGSSFFVLL